MPTQQTPCWPELASLLAVKPAALLDEDKNPWLNLLGAMGDGVLVCNNQGVILWMNAGLQAGLELNPAQLSLEMIDQMHLKKASSQVHELAHTVHEVLESGHSIEKEIKVRVGRGRPKYYDMLVSPVDRQFQVMQHVTPERPSAGCVAIFRDITTIKSTEKMRRDFVANVSHELRTPLSVLKGYTETLLGGALQEPDIARNFVEIMERHANRLSCLVEDLLDLSRLESADFELVQEPMLLQPLVVRVLSMAQDSANKKGITLLFQPPTSSLEEGSFAGKLPKVFAHPASLEQVFVNLIDNAIKYTPSGGKVTVSSMLLNEHVQFCVEDNGMGIEAKHIPRLFERFYRVDKARSRDMGGTGLGLSIVKHIVQAHGCDIWVESKPNKGTRFYFTIKLVQPNKV
jgi:two-component system, OmpR family, phosphate regulon sensor histidine kinase PhoR